MTGRLRNRIAVERARLGWTQAQAADAAGVSRQSYAAIESGVAVPSTEVALRLAAAFGRAVEELFRLPEAPVERVRARWAGLGAAAAGRRVRLGRIGGQWIAHSPGEGERPSRQADGVIASAEGGDVEVALLSERPAPADLVAVGCDPAFGIVAESLRGTRGLEVAWSPRGSRMALETLARGEAHVAGAHLHDPETGEPNARWVRELIPFPCTRIGFAIWEQGLIVQSGNPAGIEGVADLARPGVKLLNREPGSGSRMLLDEELSAAHVPATAIDGYGTAVHGHLALGEAIAAGLADAGVGIRAAGAAFGLDVVPLRVERYELIVPNHFMDLPAVGAMLDTLRRPGVRAQVEALQGYDVGPMGEV